MKLPISLTLNVLFGFILAIIGTLYATENLVFQSASEMPEVPQTAECLPEIQIEQVEVVQTVQVTETIRITVEVPATVEATPTPTVPAVAQAVENAPEGFLPETGTITLINLNTATQEDLEGLSGIGTKTAEKIIAARPFESIEGLLEVRGIGKGKFEDLANRVTVD